MRRNCLRVVFFFLVVVCKVLVLSIVLGGILYRGRLDDL